MTSSSVIKGFMDTARLIFSKFKNMSIDHFLIKAYFKIKKYVLLRFLYLRLVANDCRSLAGLKQEVRLGAYDFSGVEPDEEALEALEFQCDSWMDGIYDILGSGPVSILKAPDNIGLDKLLPAHLKSSERIIELISENYRYKHWNIDFKSQTVWSIAKPSFSCRYGHQEGVDIKVPWELARLQHLPQMAVLSQCRSADYGEPLAREIIDQIMDFWAFNPVSMGPNWICAMDAGIRAANILIAIEIIYGAFPALVTAEIQNELSNLLYHHGKFIVNNLEYSVELTSNHYLGNIAGLLFISFYLKSNKEVNCWFSFAIQEVFSEIRKQYCDDGGNFERSSSYHRLSSEMLVWALALIAGCGDKEVEKLKGCNPEGLIFYPKLRPLMNQDYQVRKSGIDIPMDVKTRMSLAVIFSIDITKHSGEVCQFGDNDSGRFIKLTPIGKRIPLNEAVDKYVNLNPADFPPPECYWDEACLNHSGYISSGAELFKLTVPDKIQKCSLESEVIKLISRGWEAGEKSLKLSVKPAAELFSDIRLSTVKTIRIKTEERNDLTKNLVRHEYLETGVIIYESDVMHLVISNMPNGALGSGAHSHNDQMSLELQIDGVDVCRDPGTYLYTSSPLNRNMFRSVSAHNVMRPLGSETNRFFGTANALFAKENESKTEIFNVSDVGCSMQLEFYGVKQQRTVTIYKHEIVIVDKSNYEFDNQLNQFQYYSKGFGFLEESCLNNENISIEYING